MRLLTICFLCVFLAACQAGRVVEATSPDGGSLILQEGVMVDGQGAQ